MYDNNYYVHWETVRRTALSSPWEELQINEKKLKDYNMI